MKTIIRKSGFLLALLLFASAAQGQDVLWRHVNGYSIDAGGLQRFDSFLIHDGRIKAIGEYATLKAAAGKAKEIDGGGQTVLPGLIDAHGHVTELGDQLQRVDLRGSKTLDEALQRIAEFARTHPDLPWLIGRGWNQVLWPGQAFPTAAALDKIVGDRPAFLERVDGHAVWVNSKALRIARFDASTKDPDGGRILRNADGSPAGVLVDNAKDLMAVNLPVPNATQRQARISLALDHLAKLGMTGVHEPGIEPDDIAAYEHLAQQGKLPLRVYVMLAATTPGLEEILRRGPRTHLYSDHLDVRSLKLYADGALGSRGAALLADYDDAPGQRGLLLTPPAELQKTALLANSLGWQVNVHAIGDAANREVLDAFAAMPESTHPREQRHRIEHAQVVALSDIPRFAQLGVIASMQPTHATSDKNMAEARIGPERIKGAYAWRRMLDSGARLAFGSDFPVELPNPFLGLYAAVTRQDLDDQPPGGWYGDQKLTREEALRGFTLDAAYAGHAEDRIGSLEPGKWADFIVVDRDYFTVPERQIADIKVRQTWVAGKRIWACEGKDHVCQ
jgi:predicted amidohydrolase YtcJ